jgi:glycerate 2-kinase
MIIENRDDLLSHGHTKGRKIALDIIDYTLESIDAYGLIRNLIRLEGNLLTVGSLTFDLAVEGNIYILGAGKAVLQMAEALEDILGGRIKQGIVVEKRLNGMTRGLERIAKLKRIKVLQGRHPVPDEAVLAGAAEILQVAQNAGRGDLVFCCVQGGCSCLTTLPAGGLYLKDIQETTELLLNSGMDIRTINAIRAALTKLSHGRLAKHIHPAEIITLVVNDYVWEYPEGWEEHGYNLGWGPSVPVSDFRRKIFEEAILDFQRHSLWKKIPENVRSHLQNLDPNGIPQTVKNFEENGIIYHTFVLANPEDGTEAAKRGADKVNVNSMILSSVIEGEASEVGVMFAGIAKEIVKNARPIKPPCVVIASGEKTVTILGEHGEGGRNQESVLSAALKIDGGYDIVIASIGTDGTDGPSYIAGGIVDGYSAQRAREKGINLSQHLKTHNSSYVLNELGDAIFFNEPGNNVCDLSLIVVTN